MYFPFAQNSEDNEFVMALKRETWLGMKKKDGIFVSDTTGEQIKNLGCVFA